MSQDTIICNLEPSDDEATIIDEILPETPLAPPDLLVHKYTPINISKIIGHHKRQAEWLKCWIETRSNRADNDSDDKDSACSGKTRATCVVLAGPPGVGKTSLVYAVAGQLGMNVVELNASQKRDANTVKKLRLANQETGFGRFLPFSQTVNVSTASIILLDDADALLEQDASFWSSMVPFIENSKRPVVLTVTQSMEKIDKLIPNCMLIIMDRPYANDVAKVLEDVCHRESYAKLLGASVCRQLAFAHDGDIRQCLNRLHFYGDNPQCYRSQFSIKPAPALYKIQLDTEKIFSSNKNLLKMYEAIEIGDVLESTFNLHDRRTLLTRWMRNIPSCRNEESGYSDRLALDIEESIDELTQKVYGEYLMSEDLILVTNHAFVETERETRRVAELLDINIRCRVVDSDDQFFTDIGPYISKWISCERVRRLNQSFRKTRRFLHYLDSIEIYLDDLQQTWVTHTFGLDSERDEATEEICSTFSECSGNNKEDDDNTVSMADDKVSDSEKTSPQRKRLRRASMDTFDT